MVDLVALYQTLQGAADKEAQEAAYQAFLDEAKDRLLPLFDEYENRRRSLGAIKARLAGALNHDEPTLRRLLFDMQAFEVPAKDRAGDDVLFELPIAKVAAKPEAKPTTPTGGTRSFNARTLLMLIFGLAAIATILGLLGQILGFDWRGISGGSYEDCLREAAGRFEENMKCHRKFGQL